MSYRCHSCNIKFNIPKENKEWFIARCCDPWVECKECGAMNQLCFSEEPKEVRKVGL